MKKQDFKNKVVIITGSSRGIGKATAIELGKRGAKIVLNGRNRDRLMETRTELESRGFTAIAVQGDIMDESDCENLMYKTQEAFGRIDVLINNASLTMNEHFEKLNPTIFNQIFCSNSNGSAMPTMAALPYLKESKGSVLFISSLAAFHGLPKASAYCAGKMSLTALWQSLKIELAYTEIHFGICYVSFTKNDYEKRMLAENGTLVPVPRRPGLIQQSQQKVARTITRMIKYRRSKRTLSVLGKLTAFSFRVFPRFILFILCQSEKKKAKLQHRAIEEVAC